MVYVPSLLPCKDFSNSFSKERGVLRDSKHETIGARDIYAFLFASAPRLAFDSGSLDRLKLMEATGVCDGAATKRGSLAEVSREALLASLRAKKTRGRLGDESMHSEPRGVCMWSSRYHTMRASTTLMCFSSPSS